MHKLVFLVVLILFLLPTLAFANSVTINFRLTISEKVSMDTPAEQGVNEELNETEEEMTEEYYEEVNYAQGATHREGKKVLIRSIVAK